MVLLMYPRVGWIVFAVNVCGLELISSRAVFKHGLSFHLFFFTD